MKRVNKLSVGILLLSQTLTGAAFTASVFFGIATAHAESSVRSISSICAPAAGTDCEHDFRSGSVAQSSIGRDYQYVESSSNGGGGYNYAAFTSNAGSPNSFSFFADAGGNATSNVQFGVALTGVRTQSSVQYGDEITIAGQGSGTIVIPWHITGSFAIRALDSSGQYQPSMQFGVPFCQSILVGASAGGLGCAGGGMQTYRNSTTLDTLVQLVYPINFGVLTALNTRFQLDLLSGSGLASGATADFSHTGLMQPVSVYDSNGFLLPDALITAASGLDYRNPQAVPEPETYALMLAGLGLIGWRARRRG